jgi:hypothetical protein
MKTMKPFILSFFITGMAFTICPKVRAQTPRIEQLGWLVGTWNRTNSKAGLSGHERWIIDASIGLKGYGVVMKGKDTVSVEKLRIVTGDDGLYYVADVIENPKPVYFKITEVSRDGFTCENPKHDFPKRIVYNRERNTLRATVSGNGKSIKYVFQKVE